ncbi:MAG: C-terminal processing protease CtpA/Prc [Limisphaerales bacterium]|jgi:C-terminal processing protease CtpA/Prc
MKTELKLFLICAGLFLHVGATAKPVPERAGFDEIFQLIKTNLVDSNAEEFEKATVRGLIRRFQGDVQLLRKKQQPEQYDGELLAKPKVFGDGIGYVRVKHVATGLAEAIQLTVEEFDSLSGLLVDLRFAGGGDYSAAVAAANQFIDADGTAIIVGQQHLRTQLNTNAISTPVTVLVNGETTGAAEVLAALLQEHNVGLLIGNQTAGEMKVFSEFEIGGGSRLRIATDRVRLGNGTAILKLDPDIAVDVSSAAEKVFLGDDIVVPRKNSNRSKLNEAELVRRLKQRNNPEAKVDKTEIPNDPAEIIDPVLARALDLFKGLSVFGPTPAEQAGEVPVPPTDL